MQPIYFLNPILPGSIKYIAHDSPVCLTISTGQERERERERERESFLEIGAGSGVFAKLVKDSNRFSRCIVVEPSPCLAESCRENGLDVIEKPIEEIDDETVFSDVSLVGCFELLEHLINPVAFVKKMYSLLPRGGILCLTTPNGLGFDILELKEKSTTLGLTHINLFNPKSLALMLENIGFTILDIATPGILDVDLVYRYYAKDSVSSQESWLKHFLLTGTDEMKQAFQGFLASSNQSSHMWAVCRK